MEGKKKNRKRREGKFANMSRKKKPFAQNKKGNASLKAWRMQLRNKAKAKKAQQEQGTLQCVVCCVEFDKKLGDHYSTELHKELRDVKRQWLYVGRVHKTLDEQIENKGSDMPFVGLQYITQYLTDKEDEFIYRCTLCKGVYKSSSVFYHVLSIQHRIFYLAKHHQLKGIDRNFQVNTREQYMHLMACTANAFQQDGMKKVKIVNQVYVPEPEVKQSVKKKNKGRKKPEPKGGPTGIGMHVINHALARLQRKRGTNNYFRPFAQHPASLNRPYFGRNPVFIDSRPQIGSSGKRQDLMGLLSAFLGAPAQMNDSYSAVQTYNYGRPAMMQEHPMINYGPMSYEVPAFCQAGINAPGTLTQTTMMGQAARPGMPQMAKPVAAQPVLPQHSTMLCRPPATIPFTKGDEGRSFQEFTVAHEAEMREMGRSEDLNSGSVGEKDDDNSNFFWCNEELYDFLGHLTMESKDVHYMLKATELFANALVRHKQRTEDIKKRIGIEKMKLELEKKAFLNAPGVKELQNKEKAKSRSPSPAHEADTKPKVTADSSSSNKPLFPTGSAPASPEPPSKAKRMMTLSSDSHRPPAPARKKTPPRRVSDTKNKRAKNRPGNRPSFGKKPQGKGGANISPRQQRRSNPKANQSRPSNRRVSSAQTLNRPQGSESKFPKRQSKFAPKDDDQGLSMRQPISASMPAFNQSREPMHKQKPASDQSRTLMNETRTSWNEQRQPSNLSWPSTTGSRNPALEGFRSTSKGAELSVKQSQVNRPEPPVKETWSSWQGERSEMNEPRRISVSEPSATSWQLKRPRTEESKPNDSEPNFESKPFWQEQRGPSKDQYINNPKSLFTEQRQPLNETRTPSNQPRPTFNEQRLSSNESRPPFNESRPSNQARPSYGASDSYTESNAYYKGNEQYPGSQYANSGSTAGARSSYGAGERRPEESDAYYTENESYAGSQYSNTGSTGGAKPSYGVGAARQGESDAYYKENERFAGSQYGNSGPAAGSRSSYGPGAGRPQESNAYYQENEQFTGSQYGNTGSTGGAKSSYGPGAGRPGDSMGSSYGMIQGNWLSSVPARSDNFPLKGPGAGSVQQQPYSSNQGTTSYNESWK